VLCCCSWRATITENQPERQTSEPLPITISKVCVEKVVPAHSRVAGLYNRS
jgi:hypothetical protein